MIDRASIVTNTILSVVWRTGLGEPARAEIRKILRDEFDDVARTTLHEIRLRSEDE